MRNLGKDIDDALRVIVWEMTETRTEYTDDEVLEALFENMGLKPSTINDWVWYGFEKYCRERSRKIQNAIKRNQSDNPKQGNLLQEAYHIVREGQKTVVQLSEMTEFEIYTKARELEKYGTSCLDHALKLRQYAKERFSGKTA